ncbi:hypothetical protein KUV23_03030 [Algoriphagus marincola]|uniref:CDP-Glycerol:Poly(Glycerophosphate) glycerophosphotransferase n=1 Tax=Algoriphagus marincola TaxID=264027 RepID=A0ABS7N0V3_9BACT|nr:hypothetical protein [Algoriphagus marincola]MBY5949929.1 hypothetical protein [Algoriphagus marincola]
MKLIVQGKLIIVGGDTKSLDDLHTKEFQKFSNEQVDKFKNSTFYVNELFIYFIQNSLALQYFIREQKINEIELKKPNSNLYFLVLDAAKKSGVQVRENFRSYKLKRRSLFYFELVSSFIYLIFLMIKIPKSGELKESKELTIVRTESFKSKLGKIGYDYLYENPFTKNSVYSFFNRSSRLVWVLKSFIKSCQQYAKLLDLMNGYVGVNAMYLVQEFYGKRLVHTNLYFYLLKNIIARNKPVVLNTGNNLDRYAFVEEYLAKENNIKLVCIPHGLEYGFKLPKCFTGDIFYATSENAVKYLNKMYNTDKFVFNKSVIKSIFSKEFKLCQTVSGKKIVYFSEPREPWVNHEIISALIPLLSKNNLNLTLKLHPKDKRSDYLMYNIEILDNIENAIVNSICISRKSTILLEAIYNNSAACAILLNRKDETLFYSFPSLQDAKINVTNSIEGLYNWINKHYQKTT